MSNTSESEKEISYKLVDASISFSAKKATCTLKMPSDDLRRYDNPIGDGPKACLFVKQPGDLHCVQMMREFVHKNILHALVVAETNGFISVWTESFKDSVWMYLQSTALGSVFTTEWYEKTVVLPTVNLQSFISQAFDGLEYLWTRGKYHGNFKLENTYYYQTSFGERVVKLTCFKLKDRETIQQCQVEDCQDVGFALKRVSDVAVAPNSQNLHFDCYILDDLATRLQNFSRIDLEFIKQDTLGHPFFWKLNEIKTFFISEIPIALNSKDFRDKVEACDELCNLPWDNKSFGGYLQVMKDYRTKKNIPDYKVNSRVSYVQFLSGIYAHEKELEMSKPVNTVVREADPHARMILYRMIPRDSRFANPRSKK